MVVKSSTPAHKERRPPGRPERGRGSDKVRHGRVENQALPVPSKDQGLDWHSVDERADASPSDMEVVRCAGV